MKYLALFFTVILSFGCLKRINPSNSPKSPPVTQEQKVVREQVQAYTPLRRYGIAEIIGALELARAEIPKETDLKIVGFSVGREAKDSHSLIVRLEIGEIPNDESELLGTPTFPEQKIFRLVKAAYQSYRRNADQPLKPDEFEFRGEWLYGDALEIRLSHPDAGASTHFCHEHEPGDSHLDCHELNDKGIFSYESDPSIVPLTAEDTYEFSCHYHGKKMHCH